MTKLWSNKQRAESNLDKKISEFLAGNDIELDNEIILFDIKASKAHALGLKEINILSNTEYKKIVHQLSLLTDLYINGKFELSHEFEDCHSAIEYYLTEKLGDLGKKIHTGRSRNDQVLVATRLYSKFKLEQLTQQNKKLAEIFIQQATKYQQLPMPGYTHLQRAVVSSWGLWFSSFAESFIDNASLSLSISKWIDANPLGTAAGYGVNLKLNRDITTKELGFSRMQINPIYAQNSRGKFELEVLSSFKQSLLDARKIAWDLSLFSMSELDFVDLPDNYSTGSSIMPNKRNPDVIELIRASYAKLVGAYNELESLLSLPSGYHRDLQFSKGPLISGVNASLQCLELLPQLIEYLIIKPEKCLQAIDSSMFATDKSIELARTGMPFRDAYMSLKTGYDDLANRTAEQSVMDRTSPGSCANLMLDTLTERLEAL